MSPPGKVGGALAENGGFRWRIPAVFLVVLFLGNFHKALAADPLETGAKGSFEITPRLDPVRPLPGEDLLLRITFQAIKPFESGPNPPGLQELGSDPASGFAGRFRIRAVERENPARFPEIAVGAPGTTWVFDYQLTPLRQMDGSFPGEVPEFGMITIRTDIPWPRLARQIHWLGPFPLRYAETKGDGISRLDLAKALPTWWLGLALACVGLLLIIAWELNLWRQSVHRLIGQIRASDGNPRTVRALYFQWLISRAVVLPAEPVPAEIQQEMTRAGYDRTLAYGSTILWSDLTENCFRKGDINAVAKEQLQKRAGEVIASWSWVPWKRRMGY